MRFSVLFVLVVAMCFASYSTDASPGANALTKQAHDQMDVRLLRGNGDVDEERGGGNEAGKVVDDAVNSATAGKIAGVVSPTSVSEGKEKVEEMAQTASHIKQLHEPNGNTAGKTSENAGTETNKLGGTVEDGVAAADAKLDAILKESHGRLSKAEQASLAKLGLEGEDLKASVETMTKVFQLAAHSKKKPSWFAKFFKICLYILGATAFGALVYLVIQANRITMHYSTVPGATTAEGA